MRRTLFALLTLMLTTGAPAVRADTIPQTAVTRAAAVIDGAIEAYGGAEALTALNSLVQKSRLEAHATYQSRRPGPPWDVSYTDTLNAIDFGAGIVVARAVGEGGGFITDATTVIDGEEGFNVDYRAGTVTPIAEPDFDTVAGPIIRITPALLVKQLMAHRDRSFWLGEATIDGRACDIVTLAMDVGPGLSLYFDGDSHLLVRSERVLAPFGRVEYRFLDYVPREGIAFNQRFELYLNGEPNLVIEQGKPSVNVPLATLAAVPEDLLELPPVGVDELALQKVADGVYLVGGNGTYAMFVEADDYVVAVGGTAGIPARIAELRKVVPDKPIRYGVITHHHQDHLVGVVPYVDAGATVVAPAAHAELVRAAAGDREDLHLELVTDRRVLGAGPRRVELYDIGPTPHAEHILVAYVPAAKVLFEADHFGGPRVGPMPPAQPVTEALAAALEVRELEVDRYIGAHSPRIFTQKELDEALARRRVELAAQG